MRASGWLWAALLFAPWIAYWVLCGLGYRAGVLAGLALAALVYAASRRMGGSMMASATIVYFMAAASLTFILGLRWLIDYSGTLGYGFLCAMCTLSLAIKNPFTYEVSKRDYPEVYWSTPEFRMVNMQLTTLWAGLFLACSIINLLPHPLSLASHPLIAVGIIASAIYPRVYVAKSMRKLAPAYARWRPPAAREVIVVGAGIGGLACAALLAKRGFKVTVLEQHYKPGGYCTSFKRKGFTFDAGVESISGLGPRGPVRWLLEELGYSPSALFVRTEEAYVIRGEWVRIPADYSSFIEMLCKRYPSEAEAIRKFLSEAEAAYREMYKEVELVGSPLPEPLIAEALGPDYLMKYPSEHPSFYRILSSKMTLREALDSYFKSEELKKILSTLTGYLGTPPEETSLASMLPIFGYYIDGGYYPKGGSQALADLLAEAIRRHGGQVLTSHRVEKVLVESGAVKGVVARGKLFKAPIVVLNVNAMNIPELVGEENLPPDYLKHLRGLKPSVTAFMVYLGVEMDLSQHPPLIKSLDEGIGVVINSNLDPSLAPQGHSSISIIALLPPEAYHEFKSAPDYKARKQAMADELIAKAERLIPGLRSRIVVQDAATPLTFERYTLNPYGAIYALSQSTRAPKRPYFKTPIRGLYLVGASTFPGAGIEAVVISGIIAANDISGWKHVKAC